MGTGIEELVDRQIRKWEQRRLNEERAALPLAAAPTICISREHGAGGFEVAQLVAKELDFDLYDREFIDEVASAPELRARVFRALGAEHHSLDAEIAERIATGRYADTEELRSLARIVCTIGRFGKGVALGRGAQFLLDPSRTLSVRLFAPFDVRVARIAAREGLAFEAARARTIGVDAERLSFCWRHFVLHAGETNQFDLLLNTARLSPPAAAHLVVEAFRARFR